MFRRVRQRLQGRRVGRRLVSLLLLVCLCASFLPLPVVNPANIKDTSTPYPCQNRPCGCRSAEECWRSCCCFSNAEKIAWAKSHGVKLPAYVFAAAAREKSRTRSTASVQRSCCAGGTCGKSCCSQGSCSHSKSPRAAAAGADPASRPAAESDVKYVIAVYAQRCQGRGAYDVFAPWVLLPLSPVTLPDQRLTDWCTLQNEVPAGAVCPPALPPPRCCAAPHWLA